MECLACEEPGAGLVNILFSNGDTSHIYLCERCLKRYEQRSHIEEIRPVMRGRQS